MKRLPIVLSAAAFVIALMGVTPLGQATRDALPFAKNADRVDTLHASKTPKAGQLYPLGANKKFPAKVLSVTRGPKGETGEMGLPGPTGPRGYKGLRGATGAQGPIGPSAMQANDYGDYRELGTEPEATMLRTLMLGAGKWFVYAQGFADNSAAVPLNLRCYIDPPAAAATGVADAQLHQIAVDGRGWFVLSAALNLSAPGTLTVSCSKERDAEGGYGSARLWAVRLGSLNIPGVVSSRAREPR